MADPVPVLSPEGEREVERVMALFEQTDDAAAIYHAVDAADDAKYAAARTALVDALQRAESAVRALVAQREDYRRRWHEARRHLRAANRGAELNSKVTELAHARETATSRNMAAYVKRAEKAETQVARLADGLREGRRLLRDDPEIRVQSKSIVSDVAFGEWIIAVDKLLASLDGGATEREK